MGYSQAQKVQGHEKILDIAGLQPGSAKSDGRLDATLSNCHGLTGCNNKRAVDDPMLSKRCA